MELLTWKRKDTLRKQKTDTRIKVNQISRRGIERAQRKNQTVGLVWYQPGGKTVRLAVTTTERTIIPPEYIEFKEIFKEKLEGALLEH